MRLFRRRNDPSIGRLQSIGSAATLDALQTFLAAWPGPRQDGYGEEEASLRQLAIPPPLRRFYAFCGRWPSPQPSRSPIVFEAPEEGFFYVGIAGDHLAPAQGLRTTADGKIVLFSEQSGNWIAATEPKGDDPPVWVEEYSTTRELAAPPRSAEHLTGWIVSHCLAALAWESANSLLCVTAEHANSGREPIRDGMAGWYRRESRGAELLRESRVEPPELSGRFYLVRQSILVHERGRLLRFAARTEAAADLLRRTAGPLDTLD
jgi:hypothetical protein